MTIANAIGARYQIIYSQGEPARKADVAWIELGANDQPLTGNPWYWSGFQWRSNDKQWDIPILFFAGGTSLTDAFFRAGNYFLKRFSIDCNFSAAQSATNFWAFNLIQVSNGSTLRSISAANLPAGWTFGLSIDSGQLVNNSTIRVSAGSPSFPSTMFATGRLIYQDIR